LSAERRGARELSPVERQVSADDDDADPDDDAVDSVDFGSGDFVPGQP
jgi:hypothetical protein